MHSKCVYLHYVYRPELPNETSSKNGRRWKVHAWMDDSQITKWLRCIFIHYSKLGPQDSATSQLTIDGRRFRQLATDAPNLLGTYLAMVDVDLAYAKAQGPTSNRRKKLTFSLFLEALMFLSWKRFPEEGIHDQKWRF